MGSEVRWGKFYISLLYLVFPIIFAQVQISNVFRAKVYNRLFYFDKYYRIFDRERYDDENVLMEKVIYSFGIGLLFLVPNLSCIALYLPFGLALLHLTILNES